MKYKKGDIVDVTDYVYPLKKGVTEEEGWRRVSWTGLRHNDLVEVFSEMVGRVGKITNVEECKVKDCPHLKCLHNGFLISANAGRFSGEGMTSANYNLCRFKITKIRSKRMTDKEVANLYKIIDKVSGKRA